MGDNKKAFLEVKEIVSILIIFAVCVCYSFLVDESFNIITFIQIMSLVTCCFYTVSIFILILNNSQYINNMYKYLSIGFSGVGFLSVSNILILKNNIEITLVYGKLSRMFYIISIFEILVFILSFLNIDKKRNIRNLFTNVMIATLIATYLAFRSKLSFFNKLQILGFNETKFIVEIVIILLYIVLVFIIRRNKEKISNRIFLNLIEYTVSRIVLSIFVIFTFEQNNIINTLIAYLIRFIGDYYVFKIIGLEVIRKPHEVLYNDLMIKSNILEEKLAELKRKNEEDEIKKELLANISHEFKTPVNVIYSAIQMQDMKRECNDINEILKFNSVIKQNCYRLIRLIDNFIDSSKLTEQNYKLNLKCLNIVSVVENTTMSILSFAEMKGIEIVFDTEEEEFFVLADKDLIERSILNILSNSIKYNKQNGVISVFVGLREEKVIVEVEDSGIGIPKEKQKYIFNRYERIKASKDGYKEGSGLGLNIVQEIVKKFNGEIKLESEEGVGTKITLIIPKVEYDEEMYEDYYNDVNFKNDIMQKVDLEMSDICI
ncbi:HAMP domain-containing sensor histidine kinase [Clostridium sp.]|uniref:sensor histidine kinase n=1 Tax=Clostridium sp. TaxID=1506 RepID=UPI0026082824|nr:HAMP domain-containing sensor histidine kinase [Clostridium sp.]